MNINIPHDCFPVPTLETGYMFASDRVFSHLDEDPVLTVVDPVTHQTANTAGVNFHTGPLQTTRGNTTQHTRSR